MLIFLDIELTSRDTQAKICSIGLITLKDGKITKQYELINEKQKILPEASAVHHITNEMIKDAPTFKDSLAYKYIEQSKATVVIHNENSELDRFLESGIKVESIIDTCRVTKHLIDECEMFWLQYLRYELRLYKNEVAEAQKCGIKDALVAHNALSDALVVKMLFSYLLELTPQDNMQKLSFEQVLLSKFSFGKYKGKYIEEIAMNDRAYLVWMLSLEDLDEDLRYSLEYYLQG